MEVKIGVQNVSREIAFETDASVSDVTAAIDAAQQTGVVHLADNKGGTVIVPLASLGYVELGEPHRARVGFGA